MGNSKSSLRNGLQCQLSRLNLGLNRKRTRDEYENGQRLSRELEDDDIKPDIADDDLSYTVDIHSPKRKRKKSTSSYIYERLFVNEETSDIRIVALGKEWNLHKMYLSQSPYFKGMFSGAWEESDKKTIYIKIVDGNIDQNALTIALGSLYTDDVFIKPVDVVGVVAAAVLLVLEDLVHQCVDVMKESLGPETVCTFYTAAEIYMQEELRTECFNWLLCNFLSPKSCALLKQIDIQLMTKLVSSHDLWVVQVEMDLYSILKKWMFIQMNPSWEGNLAQCSSDSASFWISFRTDGKCVLEMPDAQKFLPVFKEVRWQHIINDLTSIESIRGEHILPEEWLGPFCMYRWQELLRLEQDISNHGPKTIDIEAFQKYSMRCGRILSKEKQYCWRWIGHSFGVDLLIMYQNRLFSIKRSMSAENHPASYSLKERRSVCIRLTVASLEENGSIESTVTTGVRLVTLHPDEELVLLGLEDTDTFPAYVTMNLLYDNPICDIPYPRLGVPSKVYIEPTNLSLQQ